MISMLAHRHALIKAQWQTSRKHSGQGLGIPIWSELPVPLGEVFRQGRILIDPEARPLLGILARPHPLAMTNVFEFVQQFLGATDTGGRNDEPCRRCPRLFRPPPEGACAGWRTPHGFDHHRYSRAPPHQPGTAIWVPAGAAHTTPLDRLRTPPVAPTRPARSRTPHSAEPRMCPARSSRIRQNPCTSSTTVCQVFHGKGRKRDSTIWR